MPQVKFQIQTLVSFSNEQYQIAPLFSGYPVGVHQRFDAAVKMLKKELKFQMKYYQFDRETANTLLWLFFQPELESKSVRLKFTVSKQYIDQYFFYASYKVQGLTFVVLPAFEHYQFIAEEDLPILTQVENAIQKLIKKYKKNLDSNEIPDIKQFETPKNSFIHQLDINLNVKFNKFAFEKNTHHGFFASMMPSADFDGSIEITQVGQDLNESFPDQLNRSYEREEISERLKTQIFRGNRTPIVIIGKRGVGKETLIHEVLFRYLNEQMDNEQLQQHIWQINPNRIISGMSIVGWWQKRFEAIIEYARFRIQKGDKKSSYTDHLLFDNPVAMLRVGQSAQNSMNLTNVLIPYLEKRQVGVLLLATPEEWQIIQEKNRRFADLFQMIRLPEFDYKTAVKAVIQQKRSLEETHFCQFSIVAIEHLFELQRNFLHRQALPGSVMKIMNQLATRYQRQVIDLPEIRANFEEFSGLNQEIFDGSYILETGEVEKAIDQSLVGQPAAVTAISDTIHQIKSRLTNPRKPFGSFMFIGPTGVGKTQAAKVLSKYLMGNEKHLIRFDMNEFIGPDAVDRLTGTYYQPEGLLTGKIRYNPFGILLLDEIEKAHKSVHDLLLQVLDDGRLTDSLGRTVDFTNVIIIMTSNVGAREVSVQLGFETSSRSDQAIYEAALKKKFRPEFINRIDKVVIFNPLSFEHILSIARLQIQELLSRDGFVRRTTILNISQDALSWVAQRGYDSKMGGRALKRQIERDLTMLSAEQLIATNTEMPILFNIDIKDQQLVPKITQLGFAKKLKYNWIPKLPELKKAKRFFSQQLNRLQRLEDVIRQKDEEEGLGDIMIGASDSDTNWSYYNFKNNLSEIKERLTTYSLGYDSNFFKDNTTPAFRFKRPFLTTSTSEDIEDHLFAEKSMEEISENYRHASVIFDDTSTDLMNAYIDVDLMEMFTDKVLQDQIDQVTLVLKSCIDGLGKTEIDFLLNQYTTLLEYLDLAFTVDQKNHRIEISGYGIQNLFKNEAGITFFYQMHRNPIPILTQLTKKDEEAVQLDNNFKIIRYFDLQGTMLDLRTSLTSIANLNAQEFRLLVWSGMKR